MAGERRVFTREFKLGAIRLVTEKGMSVIKAASSLGIREGLLRKWKAKWEAEGEEAFPGNGKQNSRDSEVARLMAENRQLRMERDILKKRRHFLQSTRTEIRVCQKPHGYVAGLLSMPGP